MKTVQKSVKNKFMSVNGFGGGFDGWKWWIEILCVTCACAPANENRENDNELSVPFCWNCKKEKLH